MSEEAVQPAAQENTPAPQDSPVFQMQRSYLKDALFEQPNAPAIFKKQGQPEIKVSINNFYDKVEDGIYDVSVKGSITATLEGQVAFFVEVEQSAIFEIRKIPENQLEPILEINCPTMILPALRYNIADMMNRAGFQPINLTEINFRGLYEQTLAERAAAAAPPASAEAPTPIATPGAPPVAEAPAPAPTPEPAAAPAPAPVVQENMEVVVEDGRVVVKPKAE